MKRPSTTHEQRLQDRAGNVYRAERGETIDDMAHRLGVMLISRETADCVVLECGGKRHFGIDVDGICKAAS